MLKAGDSVGRFEIIAVLGHGGMGDVYEARDTKLARVVALKVVRLEGLAREEAKGAAMRLLREARAAAAIDHPNAVKIFDVGEVDGAPYLAMERLRGRTLRTYIGDESVRMSTRVKWLIEIASALGAAHARGIVHRDVKPENVIVTEEGSAKVLDFGLARAVVQVDRGAETRTLRVGDGAAGGGEARGIAEVLTAEGSVVGTPEYMAPEQLRGEAVDGRADQWAWGWWRMSW